MQSSIVTNQLEIQLNAAGETSTASSRIFRITYISRQYTIKKGYKKKLFHIFFEFDIHQE